jgi:RNA polymerase sigma-70 factor (ECF subfamily)
MNEQDAEDVTQQVFLKLAIRMTCYEPGQAPFSAWLFRVARNSAIDHLRQTRPLVLDEPLNQELEAPGDDPELRRSLQEAIDGLTADQRDALVLREIRGLSPRETAACLGKTRRAVNTNYHRARLAAKDTLESLGAIPATRA